MSSTDSISVDFPRRGRGELTPPAEYAGLREQPGLVRSALPNGSAVWLVTRHEDVRAVLTDKRISSNSSHPGFPTVGRNGTVPSTENVPGWFVALDPPYHDRFRKVLIPEFTVRRIKEMRPAIQRIVDGRVDALLAAGDSADLVSDFALPVPSLVICALLGVPYEDHDFFESRTRIMVTLTSTDDEREKATKSILRYVTRLIAIKAKMPADDLLSRLVATKVLTTEELSGVALLLLIAGHETTANSIGLGVVTLLINQQWIGDPRIVEELLRFLSVADLVALRVAVEDVEIGGQLIKAGEGIVPLGAAANHDGCAFADASEFNPGRPARHHVAFGYGIHQCLGQNLVRAELDIAFKTLFERIPGIQLAQRVEDLPFKYDGILFGLHALPVRW
jgi:cytochrome P450 monooxygenase